MLKIQIEIILIEIILNFCHWLKCRKSDSHFEVCHPFQKISQTCNRQMKILKACD